MSCWRNCCRRTGAHVKIYSIKLTSQKIDLRLDCRLPFHPLGIAARALETGRLIGRAYFDALE